MKVSDQKLHNCCPISGSTQICELRGYERHHLMRCSDSSFVFCHPIPSEQVLADHYDTYNRSLTKSPITISRYNELLDSFEKYRKTNRLYDIGCGMGDFLFVAKARGWEVRGSEYTDEAVKACGKKGIEADTGAPDKAWYPEGQFDIACSFEVIEHLSFPVEHVEFAQHLLRKGGIFYCTTPNFDSLERRLMKAECPIIEYPEHLSYFTKKTIHMVMRNHGFKKVKLSTTGISPQKILKKTEDESASSPSNIPSSMDEKLRQSLESGSKLKLGLKNVANWILDQTRLGNSLKATYQKL